MVAFYGFVGLILIITLFFRKWKIAKWVFIILLILTPFAGHASKRESFDNYEKATIAMKEKEYDKAKVLFKKVKNYGDFYQDAQIKIKEIDEMKKNNNNSFWLEDNKNDKEDYKENLQDYIILGSNKNDVCNFFYDYKIDKNYEKNVDVDGIKFFNEDMIVVIDFDKSGIAEGVSFLSNNFSDFQVDGDCKNSYVNMHYDELVKLATGGKDIKIEKNVSSEYPVEIYIGNIH